MEWLTWNAALTSSLYHCTFCCVLGLDATRGGGRSPFHAMEVSLNVVTLVVEQENDRFELLMNDGREFLDGELPR